MLMDFSPKQEPIELAPLSNTHPCLQVINLFPKNIFSHIFHCFSIYLLLKIPKKYFLSRKNIFFLFIVLLRKEIVCAKKRKEYTKMRETTFVVFY